MSKRRVTILWQGLHGISQYSCVARKKEKCHKQQMPDNTPFAIDEVFPTMLGDRAMAETEDSTCHAYYL